MATKGRIHERFAAQVAARAAEAAACGRAAKTGSGRVWMIGSPGGWSGDPLDVPGTAAAYDRSEIGADFEAALDPQDPAAVGVTASLRFQNDYLAVMERAARLRSATQVRCEMFAAARRAGAEAATRTTLRYAQDLLKLGQE